MRKRYNKIFALTFMLALFLAWAVDGHCQTSVVSATVVDGAAQAFANGTYRIEYQNPPGTTEAPNRIDTGTPLLAIDKVKTGNLDAAGAFSTTLIRTDNIAPKGGTWKIQVCPNASTQCTYISTLVAAPTFNASSLLTTAIGTLAVNLTVVPNTPYAYNESEPFGQRTGSSFWDTGAGTLKYWNGIAWVSLASGTGTYNVNNFTGADFGAKVNAAIAAAPAGGIVYLDGRGMYGNMAWTTQIVINKPIVLELCGVNAQFTSAAIAGGLINITTAASGTQIITRCGSGRNVLNTKFTVQPSSGVQDIISIGNSATSDTVSGIVITGLGIVANVRVRDFIATNSCGVQHKIARNFVVGPGAGTYATGYFIRQACSNGLAENDAHLIEQNQVQYWAHFILDGVSSVSNRMTMNRMFNLSGAALQLSKSSNFTIDGNDILYVNETNTENGAVEITGSAFGVDNVALHNNHFENNGGAGGTGVDVYINTTSGNGTVDIRNNRFYAGQSLPGAKAIRAIGVGNRNGVIGRNEFDSHTACELDLAANFVALATEDNYFMSSDRAVVRGCGAGFGDAGKHMSGQVFVEDTPAGGFSLSLPNNRPIQIKDASGTYQPWMLPGGDNSVYFAALAAGQLHCWRSFGTTTNTACINNDTGRFIGGGFSTTSVNVAGSGTFRLAHADTFNVRNTANSADLSLFWDVSDYWNLPAIKVTAGAIKADVGVYIGTNASALLTMDQIKRTTTGCTTAASIGATCDTTVTWTNGFVDTSYYVQCTGNAVTSGVPVHGGIITIATGTVTFRTVALTAVAAKFTNIDCIAFHQ